MQHKMRIKTEEILPKYHKTMNVTVNVFDVKFNSDKCDNEVELIGEEA